jgi:hypothetical protein
MSIARLVLLLPMLVLLAPRAHAEPAENLARELSRLRAEAESLSDKIGRELEDRRVRLRGLAEQKTLAEGERRREQQRRDELVTRRDKLRAALAEAADQEAELVPAVMALIAVLRAEVEHGLPYRRAERLGAVTTLASDLEERRATPSQVFTRLWESVEDELRLGREVALDRQVVALPDGERLVDVVRVGMVLLYFRAADGRVGQAAWKDGWSFHYLTAEADIARVEAAFASFDKRVMSGFFSLPLVPGGLR